MEDLWIQEAPEAYGDQFEIEDKRRQFIMIDFAVVENMAKLGKNAFVVYCALVRFASKDRVAYPSWKKLQAVTGLGHHSVRNALRELQKWELIEATQRRKSGSFSSNSYSLPDLASWNPPCYKNTDVQKTDVHKLYNKLDVSSSELDPEEGEGNARAESQIYPSGEDEKLKDGGTTPIYTLADDFTIDDEMREWATRQWTYIDIDATTEIWKDEMRAKGLRYSDWKAAWRSSMNRMINEWGRGVYKHKTGAKDRRGSGKVVL